ncbi:glycoside hydrolase family 76 protein [Zasmidium cellare ATCC 36951]|uniref:Glycoside hydrolase family 76 protein n=1 Tax=Zasmidium cellare ATCC 36951 TaxID=1080233 RepID=A0A6A6CRR0_ZASCE|nr:glycoside hydrolase family 76 protein [Zasmidium cellare ATCC 36951]KAF2168512.1 glycoside hydrolase family 76 protein [Zasmidium cellare ATCC 36951]
MQTEYFELWVGAWPSAIDWTAAVMNTQIVSSMATFSRALDDPSLLPTSDEDYGNSVGPARDIENDLNRYFSQSVAYYFGEDAFAIRNEANDDMLWVVLSWLEAIKLIDVHSRLHYHSPGDGSFRSWHGTQFVKAFAHRARVFYDLAARGWDTTLCGGGMVWNSHLEPYKNAITNELFIAASVGMYLYFPGDHNPSPFMAQHLKSSLDTPDAEPHDPSYLAAAVQGYDWLKKSNMTNTLGLYVDGFHISGLRRNSTICDARNEMVYTYNQGVLLSGLRGLWESTGNTTYMFDGHELARNAIKATGWLFDLDAATSNSAWAGLGRAGILEEFCDAQGDCSQDGQTFKGIFFHHLTLFCVPLPALPLYPGKTHAAGKELALLHHQSCQEYALWIAHNARAAVSTRDADGKFGSYWGEQDDSYLKTSLPDGATDYRNNASELLNWPWMSPSEGIGIRHQDIAQQQRLKNVYETAQNDRSEGLRTSQDPNDRGRGRTVETQAGGVAVLKALWELLYMQ